MKTRPKNRFYYEVEEEFWDDPGYMEFTITVKNDTKILKIATDIFDGDGRLKVITPEDWSDENIYEGAVESPSEEEEIPF